ALSPPPLAVATGGPPPRPRPTISESRSTATSSAVQGSKTAAGSRRRTDWRPTARCSCRPTGTSPRAAWAGRGAGISSGGCARGELRRFRAKHGLVDLAAAAERQLVLASEPHV